MKADSLHVLSDITDKRRVTSVMLRHMMQLWLLCTGDIKENLYRSRCSEGSWELRQSDPDNQTLRRTAIYSGGGSGRWHSGTHPDHMLDILQKDIKYSHYLHKPQ